jgi:hypothetical protein
MFIVQIVQERGKGVADDPPSTCHNDPVHETQVPSSPSHAPPPPDFEVVDIIFKL